MSYIVVKQTKSIGIAILLTLLFGPLGLFYASVTAGLIMTFTPVLFYILFLILFIHGASEGNLSLTLLYGSLGISIIFGLTYPIAPSTYTMSMCTPPTFCFQVSCNLRKQYSPPLDLE